MMVSRTKQWLLTSGLALAAAAAAAGGPTLAQQTTAPRALTAGDYARAEQYMAYNTTPLVLRSGVRPTWLPDGRFWYRIATEKGTEAFIVDPVKAGEGAVRSAGLRRRRRPRRCAGPSGGRRRTRRGPK